MPTCQRCKHLFEVSEEGMVSAEFTAYRPQHLPEMEPKPTYTYLFCKPCAMHISSLFLDDHKLDPTYRTYKPPETEIPTLSDADPVPKAPDPTPPRRH